MISFIAIHEVLEFCGSDFRDAFKQPHTLLEEQRYLFGQALGGWFYYTRILFGFGSGPLQWGRVAAAVGRIVQSTYFPADLRHHTYVDDPIAASKGTKEEVDMNFLAL